MSSPDHEALVAREWDANSPIVTDAGSLAQFERWREHNVLARAYVALSRKAEKAEAKAAFSGHRAWCVVMKRTQSIADLSQPCDCGYAALSEASQNE